MAKMKKGKYSYPVDYSAWELACVDKLKEAIDGKFEEFFQNAAAEAMQILPDQFDALADFSAGYTDTRNGLGNIDEITFTAFFDQHREHDGVSFRTTISDLVKGIIELHEHGEDGYISDKAKTVFRELAESLRKSSDVLYEAVNRKEI